MRMKNIIILAFLAGVIVISPIGFLCAEEPALPVGLEEPKTSPAMNEPALPAGLESDDTGAPALPAGLGGEAAEPALPAGLEDTAPEQSSTPEATKKTFMETVKDAGFGGFMEVRGGVRTQNDPYEKQASLGETRFQLEWQKSTDWLTMKFTGDFLYDQVYNKLSDIDLRRGQGWFDLRESWVGFSPMKWVDVKMGRQVLTWGTGDLLFVNDLFPKDWQAFFIGRDLEYLKAPSDAIKVSAFSDIVDVDFVFIPLMNPSRYISGRRLSYFNRNLNHLAGRNAIIQDELPSRWFADAEYAARLSRKLGSYELAAYGSWGFYKTPEGFDMARNKAFYPRLNTYGASVRGPFWRGIANFEGAYYDSVEDRSGNDPLLPNSQVRLLAGYEMSLPEIAKDLTVGVQYYVEIMMNHDRYVRTQPIGQPLVDEGRQVITLRITKLLLDQNLTLGLFTYYSPTDNDVYMRPNIKYKIDDNWTVEAGGNVFFGEHPYTFFGQFEQDSNVYASLRYSF